MNRNHRMRAAFRSQGSGQFHHRVDAGLSQSFAAHVSKQVLLAIPVDVSRADQPLELFWRERLAGDLPLQLSDHLLHAARSPKCARPACALARAPPACSPGTMLGLPRRRIGPARAIVADPLVRARRLISAMDLVPANAPLP